MEEAQKGGRGRAGSGNTEGKEGEEKGKRWEENLVPRSFLKVGAYGRYGAVMEACCLDVDVAALSDGHSTLIGDRGVTLSGGQRQRVSLARAVYSDRDIYLLDDPLASIDPDVALTVFQRVVLDLLKDKTVLIVTHQIQVTVVCSGGVTTTIKHAIKLTIKLRIIAATTSSCNKT